MRRWVIIPGRGLKTFAALLVVSMMAVLLCTVLWQGSEAVMGRNFVVVIDAGHGGYDPGAITQRGTYEKNINLDIAKKVQNLLGPTGMKVIMTRDEDEDYVPDGASGRRTKKQIDLNYRINTAAEAKADVFVSIHVNAIKGAQKSGAETFYHYKSDSGKQLAEAIQQELIKVPGMNRRIAKPGDFYVIKNTPMPAVIVEVGYLSNPNEEEKLLQDWYQDQIAKAIAKGIGVYMGVP